MLTFTRDLQFLKVAEATEVINLGIFTVASDQVLQSGVVVPVLLEAFHKPPYTLKRDSVNFT
jgi:hypothetical protein